MAATEDNIDGGRSLQLLERTRIWDKHLQIQKDHDGDKRVLKKFRRASRTQDTRPAYTIALHTIWVDGIFLRDEEAKLEPDLTDKIQN
ncbi:hypothetical protein SLE2022_093680 [Rubroshorea leprosula]